MIKLRVSRPELPRPFRVGLSVRVRGAEIPLPAVVGAVLTFAVWIVAMVTHPAARYAGPAWLAAGIVVYLLVRRSRGERLMAHVVSADEQVLPETQFSRVLVPMKLGEIGEEMVATAVKLAQDRGATVDALHVIRVPMELPLDAELAEEERSAADSLLEAQALGEDHRRRGDRPHRAGARDRRGDRPGGGGARHRPDRARLVATLAAAVALLLAHGRVRPPQGALRGAHRRLSRRAFWRRCKAATLRL